MIGRACLPASLLAYLLVVDLLGYPLPLSVFHSLPLFSASRLLGWSGPLAAAAPLLIDRQPASPLSRLLSSSHPSRPGEADARPHPSIFRSFHCHRPRSQLSRWHNRQRIAVRRVVLCCAAVPAPTTNLLHHQMNNQKRFRAHAPSFPSFLLPPCFSSRQRFRRVSRTCVDAFLLAAQ
ncbi:hypothetical protein HDK77DRAFT_444575 [Phyllosticta capitalensis]